MKPQIIVIAGGPESGKTSLAKIIAGNRVTTLLGNLRTTRFLSDPFLYKNVTKKTECIIADDMNVKHLEKYLQTLFYEDTLTVYRMHKHEFTIQRPTVIVTCECELLYWAFLRNTNPYKNRVSFIYLDKAAIASCPIID